MQGANFTPTPIFYGFFLVVKRTSLLAALLSGFWMYSQSVSPEFASKIDRLIQEKPITYKEIDKVLRANRKDTSI